MFLRSACQKILGTDRKGHAVSHIIMAFMARAIIIIMLSINIVCSEVEVQ